MKKIIGILTVLCLCISSCLTIFAQSRLSIRIFKSNNINDLHNVVCEQTGYLVTCLNIPKNEITSEYQNYAWNYFLSQRDRIVKENYTEEQINSYKSLNNLTDDQAYDNLYVKYWNNQRKELEEKLSKNIKK